MNTITINQLAPTWRARFLVQLFELSKEPYRLFFKQNIKAWSCNLQDLRNFPQGTLGRDLASFLTDNQFQLEPKLENHDVMHVLLQYQLNVVDEISMQFFCFASGKQSIYNKFTMLISLIVLPEYLNDFVRAYLRGLQAINFHSWDFEHLLKEKTSTLRAIIFKQTINDSIII